MACLDHVSSSTFERDGQGCEEGKSLALRSEGLEGNVSFRAHIPRIDLLILM